MYLHDGYVCMFILLTYVIPLSIFAPVLC